VAEGISSSSLILTKLTAFRFTHTDSLIVVVVVLLLLSSDLTVNEDDDVTAECTLRL